MEKKENPLVTDAAEKIAIGIAELAKGTTALDVLLGLSFFVASYCKMMCKHHPTFDVNRFYCDFMLRLAVMRRLVDEVEKELRSKKTEDEE